jgi:hypothetical protein
MSTSKWEKDVMSVLTKFLSLRLKWLVEMGSKYLAEISTGWVIALTSSGCFRATSQLLGFILAQW